VVKVGVELEVRQRVTLTATSHRQVRLDRWQARWWCGRAAVRKAQEVSFCVRLQTKCGAAAEEILAGRAGFRNRRVSEGLQGGGGEVDRRVRMRLAGKRNSPNLSSGSRPSFWHPSPL
jgi:hypothetical protein